MGTTRWPRVAQLFETAVTLPPDQRATYLDQACSGDPGLRREVEALLRADNASSAVLQGAVGAAARQVIQDLAPAHDLAGRRIGPYEVTRELGHGGMGIVYLAVRADGAYNKTVAIKVIRRGADSSETRRRFFAERQILATFDHPNIARLMDGGATPEGRPFVVMEYIEGEPLDAYCDQRTLSLAARLRLFLKVCDAVQYAHGNLVVHRDIKPRNILVTRDGSPKLLDFGIAKLLDAPRGQPVSAVRVMTPEYASPEQIRGEPITTRTDVYSLGVVLHELLTGQRPFRDASNPIALARAVCEDVPSRPSAVARDAPMTDALRRGSRPERLRRELSGDLDAIVGAALEKEPARRYSSVELLSEDVRRHLDGQPVSVRRNDFTYRAGKFVRRYRAGVVAAIAIVVLSGFYAVRVTRERDRAQREARGADEVATFLQDLFKSSDPAQSRGRDVTARELVDRGAARLDRDWANQPEMRATMLGVIGGAYHSLGLYDTASATLREAVALRRAISPDSRDAADLMSLLALSLEHTGDLKSADSVYREALAIGRRTGTNAEIASYVDGLGVVLLEERDYAGAERLLREAVARLEREPNVDSLTLATARTKLAGALDGLGKRDSVDRPRRP